MRDRNRGGGEENEERQHAKPEADLVANRLEELREKPIDGNFDVEHLKAIHAYIFQDLPHHLPGVIRDDTADTWIKHRGLEGGRRTYEVPYVSKDVAQAVTDILHTFGGVRGIRDMPPEQAADRLAKLYGDLDHAHGFYEGNSRTLREFSRELADRAGFDLDWVGRPSERKSATSFTSRATWRSWNARIPG